VEQYTFDTNLPPLLIEVTPASSATSGEGAGETYRGIFDKAQQAVSAASDEAVKSAFRTVWMMARNTGWMIQDLQQHPDQQTLKSVSVEFGLNFNGEGQVYVAKGSVGASISISMTWEAK
jgi:hypothetical protein